MVDDIISALPEDPIDALLFIVEAYFSSQEEADETFYLSMYGILQNIIQKNGFDYPIAHLHHTDHGHINSHILITFTKIKSYAVFKDMERKLHVKQNKRKLDDSQKNRIQPIINELRDLVRSSDLFGDDHKQRILSRLEDLQQEVHKSISDYQLVCGKITTLGRVLGNFGKDIKPITDRVRDIFMIASEADHNDINPQLPQSYDVLELTSSSPDE